MQKENTFSFTSYFLFNLYIIFFVSIVFSFRAISSISIGLILAIGLTQSKGIYSRLSRHRNLAFFLLSCSLFYVLQCLALTYTQNVHEGLRLLQRSSGIILIPLSIFSATHLLAEEHHRKLPFYFATILFVGSLYCLGMNFFNYFSGAPVSTLFYHDLVKPLSQHAIQFSILIFIALTLLMGRLKEQNHRLIKSFCRPMIAFLSLFLVLLSSKLIICFYLSYLLYFFRQKKISKPKSLVLAVIFITAVTIAAITPTPLGNRFREMFKGNSMLFVQEKFTPGTYFNGFQFRLLQWRFTYEILNEQHAWLYGLGPGDAQIFLNKKYAETNMYTGIAGTTDHGYLNYHTHNQFLQCLLENGFPALLIFFLICFALFKMAAGRRRTELKWLAVLLLIYCFTDAPFETQYGIVLFTFFPVFLGMTSHFTLRPDSRVQQSNRHDFIKALTIKQPN